MLADYTPLALVRMAAENLPNSNTARLDAELLMSATLNCTRVELPLKQTELTVAEATQFTGYIERRQKDEPVAYILGTQEFWSLEFKVTPDTLIPRPDTETLVEAALGFLKDEEIGHILDLGTGSGCVLLSLLSELKNYKGVGVDQSSSALLIAEENAENLGLSDRVNFVKSDWFLAVEKPAKGFNAIVSNPPYIPSEDIQGLMQDVRDYEPISALDGGGDGLTPYRHIAQKAHDYLSSGGVLAFEHGIHQSNDISDILKENNYKDIKVFKDLAGIKRVIIGKKVN